MTTKQLSEATGIPKSVIWKFAEELDAMPIGGRHGFEFPKDSPKRIRAILRERHEAFVAGLSG